MTSRLGALRKPVLVIWGEADQIVPASVGQALADAVPQAYFHVLPNCGHLLTLEAPAKCVELFAEFLEDEANQLGL